MKLLLCNTQLDRNNDNVLLFNNKNDLYNYYYNLTDKVITDEVNFNANDLINTSVFVRVGNNLNLFKILNYNYCIVIQNNTDEKLYYFIERSYQDSGNNIKLDLKLDVFNTYIAPLLNNQNNMQGLIEKTHLDRFIKQGSNYRYNFKDTSPFFERDDLKNLSKRATKKFELKFKIDNKENSNFNNFITNNVACWQYIYLSKNSNYSYFNFDGTNPNTNKIASLLYYMDEDEIYQPLTDSNFVVLVAPIMKTGKKIYISNGTITREFNLTALEYFLTQNNDYANVQAIKFSCLPPLEVKDYSGQYSFDNDGNLILNGGSYFISGTNNTNAPVFKYIREQNITNGFELYLDNYIDRMTFTKAQIDEEKQPKLFNEDYATYKLFIGGQQYEFPISKTSDKPSFIYKEILSPDITKANICFNPASSNFASDSVFKDISTEDFTGFNLSIDLSMWFPSNQLDNYLANNKNYLQIFNNNQTLQQQLFTLDSAQGLINGTIDKGLKGFAVGLNNTIIGSGKLLITQMTERQNMELTLDNMSNAPETTSNINSNPILIYAVSKLKMFIEKLEILPFEKQILIDNFKMFGYNYNKIEYIKDFYKTRKYYNYLQSLIYEVDAPYSEAVKDEIKNVFANGIRIWHADAWEDINNFMIDFNLNNIERSVENE